MRHVHCPTLFFTDIDTYVITKKELPSTLSPVSPSFREESQRIADIYLSRKAEFLVFTTYIGHYDRSMSLLEDSCRSSPAFAAIVHQFEVRTTALNSKHKKRNATHIAINENQHLKPYLLKVIHTLIQIGLPENKNAL